MMPMAMLHTPASLVRAGLPVYQPGIGVSSNTSMTTRSMPRGQIRPSWKARTVKPITRIRPHRKKWAMTFLSPPFREEEADQDPEQAEEAEHGAQVDAVVTACLADSFGRAWVGSELFELDAQGGCPRGGYTPDYFSPTASSGATRCITGHIINESIMHGGCAASAMPTRDLRPAHASTTLRGFDAYWAVRQQLHRPTGKWENGPGMDLFRALGKRPSASCPSSPKIWATSLPSVRKLLDDSTFPGMKVLQFAFGGGDNSICPHDHVKNSVVCQVLTTAPPSPTGG